MHVRIIQFGLGSSRVNQIVWAGLAWFGSVTNSNLSLAHLRLTRKWDVQPELRSGLEGSAILELGWAQLVKNMISWLDTPCTIITLQYMPIKKPTQQNAYEKGVEWEENKLNFQIKLFPLQYRTRVSLIIIISLIISLILREGRGLVTLKVNSQHSTPSGVDKII